MTGSIPLALVFSAALTLAANFTFAQDKPDFSGSWVLASGPTDADVPQALSIQQPLHRTNRLGEPVTPFYFDITIARTLPTGTKSETSERREMFSLTPNGELRVETTSHSTNADKRTVTLVYRRP